MERCAVEGCSNEARWAPIILLYAPGCGGPAKLSFNLPVCNVCKDDTTVDDYVSDEGWLQILAALRAAGKPPAVRDMTQLDWQTMESMYADLERVRRAAAGH